MAITINGTTGIAGVDGSASTPAVQGTDTNTGVFFPAADTIAFSEGGTEAMRIDSNGNVGIGTSSPISLGAGYTSLTINNATNGGGIAFATGGTQKGAIFNVNNDLYFDVNNGAGNLYFRNTGDGTTNATINSSGDFLVGTDNPSANTGDGVKLRPNADNGANAISVLGAADSNTYNSHHLYSSGANAYRFYVGYGGTVYATNTTITAISDQRLKENIEDIDVGLDAVMSLKPRKFDWKEGKGKNKKGDRGWIAQEFELVFPEMIDTWLDSAPEGEEPYKAVNADLIPILVKAIQELKAELDTVKAQNAAFEARLAALEAK